ncbi:hypothetical protein XENOCAPTIV_021602, partial [Xenoophorus captivus]
IVSRCDICLLQHVVDPDGKAIKALLTLINRYCQVRNVSIFICKLKSAYFTLTSLCTVCV